ncbi:hypothetical protein Ahy_A05g025598 [Arachis hypogaea]|uniref:CCHC-type domain-containing protein n=1 Tax=Arachis hypogaea TaxID=3818 RepID=A0A445D936_ARAHY|nr:hypothetical protein Ahy_A05g025598 [Arachis hypogaea]
MEFWVQVHGIPIDYMSKKTAIHIGNMLGVVAEVENPKVDGVLRRSFLRIRVGINITKAPPTGFWLAREKSSNLWVYFQYERLPECYCYNCGIIGHEKKNCKNQTAMAVWDLTKPKYSAGLGVSQVRSTTSISAGSSRQGGWKDQYVEETMRGQQSMRRGSEDRQDTEESMIRDEQNLQHELREDDFLKNQFEEQMGREEITQREIKSQDQKEHHGAEASYEAHIPRITEHEVLIHNNQTNGSNRKVQTQKTTLALYNNSELIHIRWSYRSNKEKMSENKKESKKEKYKQEYKAESGDMYYVELASDGEEEAKKMVENNRGTSG